MIFVEKKLLQEMRDEEPVSWMGIMWNSVKKTIFRVQKQYFYEKELSESADERYLFYISNIEDHST